MAGRLADKVAVITGAVSGIGLATVELFLEEGARVVAADVQDEKGAALQSRFEGRLAYVHCDVTEEKDLIGAVNAAVTGFGGIDILFNNAGAGGTINDGDVVLIADAYGRVQNATNLAIGGGTKIYPVGIARTKATAINDVILVDLNFIPVVA